MGHGNPWRSVFEWVSGVAREVADTVDQAGEFIEHVDSETCSECRWPTKPELQCSGGACSDCCARVHNHIGKRNRKAT